MALIGRKKVASSINKLIVAKNDKLRTVFLQGLGNIAKGSPIDEGRARSNWFLKVGSPSNEKINSTNGDPHLDKMPDVVIGKRLFYANNLPYINALEYGLYKGVGTKTVLSNGGIYSDQAAGGWVRSELLRMRAGIRKI